MPTQEAMGLVIYKGTHILNHSESKLVVHKIISTLSLYLKTFWQKLQK